MTEPATTDGPARRRSTWRPVVPIPADVPQPRFRHPYRGEAQEVFEYRFEGALWGYVCRFTASDGRPELLPYTWCVDEGDERGLHRWHWRTWDAPRPLYVPAGELSADRALPVVVVGDERHAAAGERLLGREFDFVTWPGGDALWAKALWSWLQGREVLLWPSASNRRERLTQREADAGIHSAQKPLLPEVRQPAVRAMLQIGELLWTEYGCKVRVCSAPDPGAKPDGWGIADIEAAGESPAVVRSLIMAARVWEPRDASARAKGVLTPSIAGAGNQSVPDVDAWRAKLLLTKEGSAKPVRENIVLALDGLPALQLPGAPEVQGVIAYNELSNDVVKLRPSPWGTPAGAWDEVDDLLMGEWLVREHWLPSVPRGTLEEAVRMVAWRHRFHPVRDWLTALRWDGVERLRTWVRRACLEEDEWDDDDPLQRYLSLVGTFFLMAMCARVLRPGVKFDYMLILEGEQGMRKSTLLRTLAGQYFADTGLALGEKDGYQQLQGVWLYEISELDAFSKADVMKIKSYVASAEDYFRASFDRRARKYPRQLVFGGTTNEDHYLTDPTGNRRFWPVRVTRLIDIDWVAANREQLFAEAMTRVQAGERMWPTPEEELQLFAPQQQQRAVENAIGTAVARFLYDEDQQFIPGRSKGTDIEEITLVELLGRIGIGIEKLGPGRFHEKQAAAALRRLGWKEARSSAPGRPRVYRRPDKSSQPPASASGVSSPHQDAGAAPERADSDCPF